MRTYNISSTEQETVDSLTTSTAGLDVTRNEGPILPTQVRKLSAGWVGAEWVRAVADYQDSPSVGYASLADLERDHEFSADWDLPFEAVRS